MSLLRYYLNSLESLHLQEPDPGNSLRNLVYKQDEPNARHKQANICARYPELPEQNAERFSTVRRQGESFHLLSVIQPKHQINPNAVITNASSSWEAIGWTYQNTTHPFSFSLFDSQERGSCWYGSFHIIASSPPTHLDPVPEGYPGKDDKDKKEERVVCDILNGGLRSQKKSKNRKPQTGPEPTATEARAKTTPGLGIFILIAPCYPLCVSTRTRHIKGERCFSLALSRLLPAE